MSHVYAALEFDQAGQPGFGFLTTEDLAFDASHPGPHDPHWRVVSLTAIPRGPKLVFAPEVFENAGQVLWSFALPTPAMRDFMARALRQSTASGCWMFIDPHRQVRLLDITEVAETATSWRGLGSEHQAFLVQMPREPTGADPDAVAKGLERMLLSAGHPPLSGAASPAESDAYTRAMRSRAVDCSRTPEQSANLRRYGMLARAREEHWLNSECIGHLLGGVDRESALRLASEARADGRLLGLWDGAKDPTFLHPRFQFQYDGSPHPSLPDLLSALSRLSSLGIAEDRSGWGRINWLIQPRAALSERSLAEAMADRRVPDDLSVMDERPRSPAELFVTDPDAVIALVHEDVEAARGA